MLTAGEDPLFLARRLVRMAIEDVGLADPDALHQALAAKDTYDFLGSPEGELALAQATIYIATAPEIECVLHCVWSLRCGGQRKRVAMLRQRLF